MVWTVVCSGRYDHSGRSRYFSKSRASRIWTIRICSEFKTVEIKRCLMTIILNTNALIHQSSLLIFDNFVLMKNLTENLN